MGKSLLEIYETAGQDFGLEVWRVEDFELVEVPKKFYGQFYDGDSYVILWTYKNEEDEKCQNLHFWIGSESSQDEYGAAAIIVTQMDTANDDLPVQFRETESHESSLFLSYFKKVEYKHGGVASGFTHVEINEDDNKRLLRVKGRGRNVVAKEVDFTWDSFTCDDVYIIELGADIYRWKGAGANMFEWMESDKLSKEIRDNEQSGRGEIFEIDGAIAFTPAPVVEALGGEQPADLPSSGSDKKVAEKSEETAILYKVSNDSGTLETTKAAVGPNIEKDILETDDCYILDCSSSGNMFVWKGKTSDPKERNQAMKSAITFLKKSGQEKNCNVQVFPQGSEPMLFQEMFKDW